MTLAVTHSALALPVAPPPGPGAWKQAGAAVTSKPGKLAHYFRAALHPTALAVVASSSSAKPIRMTWFGYCEEQSDDGMSIRSTTSSGCSAKSARSPGRSR